MSTYYVHLLFAKQVGKRDTERPDVPIAANQETVHAEFLSQFFDQSTLPAQLDKIGVLPLSPCLLAGPRLREEGR